MKNTLVIDLDRCSGCDSCVAACKFDALHIGPNGAAVVDKEKCTNCGACREACPRKLIVEVPYSKKVFVNCSNKDKGAVANKLCTTSCIACGMCERTCKFDAIHVVDGVAKVDPEKCTGCLQCAAVCPRKVIVPVSYDADIVIACSNHERGAYTRRECDMGCVGCHLCEKQCEFDAIHVVNNLAVIDYSKCVSCGRCAAVCPRKLISDSNLRQDMDAVPAMPR